MASATHCIVDKQKIGFYLDESRTTRAGDGVLEGLAAPTRPDQAASKRYVDDRIAGVDPHEAVDYVSYATTFPVAGDTIHFTDAQAASVTIPTDAAVRVLFVNIGGDNITASVDGDIAQDSTTVTLNSTTNIRVGMEAKKAGAVVGTVTAVTSSTQLTLSAVGDIADGDSLVFALSAGLVAASVNGDIAEGTTTVTLTSTADIRVGMEAKKNGAVVGTVTAVTNSTQLTLSAVGDIADGDSLEFAGSAGLNDSSPLTNEQTTHAANGVWEVKSDGANLIYRRPADWGGDADTVNSTDAKNFVAVTTVDLIHYPQPNFKIYHYGTVGGSEGYFYGANGLSTTPGGTAYDFGDVTLYGDAGIAAASARPISDEEADPAATWVSYDAMQVSRGAYVAVCCGMTTGAGANQGGNLGRGAAYILSVDKADLATEQKIFVFRSSNLDFSQGVDYNTIQVDAESKLSLQIGSAQHLSGVAESAETAWQYRDFNDLSTDDSNGIEPRHLHTRFVQYLSDKIDARVKGADVVETTGTKMASLPASFSTIALGTVPDLKAYIDGTIGATDTSRGSYVDAETLKIINGSRTFTSNLTAAGDFSIGEVAESTTTTPGGTKTFTAAFYQATNLMPTTVWQFSIDGDESAFISGLSQTVTIGGQQYTTSARAADDAGGDGVAGYKDYANQTQFYIDADADPNGPNGIVDANTFDISTSNQLDVTGPGVVTTVAAAPATFTVAASSGNTVVAGTLGVTGETILSSTLSLGANLDVTLTGTYAVDTADPIDVDIFISPQPQPEDPDTATVTLQGTNDALDAGTYMLQQGAGESLKSLLVTIAEGQTEVTGLRAANFDDSVIAGQAVPTGGAQTATIGTISGLAVVEGTEYTIKQGNNQGVFTGQADGSLQGDHVDGIADGEHADLVAVSAGTRPIVMNSSTGNIDTIGNVTCNVLATAGHSNLDTKLSSIDSAIASTASTALSGRNTLNSAITALDTRTFDHNGSVAMTGDIKFASSRSPTIRADNVTRPASFCSTTTGLVTIGGGPVKISAAGAATSVDGTLDLAGDFEIGYVAESTTTTTTPAQDAKSFTAMYSPVGGPVTVAHWSFVIDGDESAFISGLSQTVTISGANYVTSSDAAREAGYNADNDNTMFTLDAPLVDASTFHTLLFTATYYAASEVMTAVWEFAIAGDLSALINGASQTVTIGGVDYTTSATNGAGYNAGTDTTTFTLEESDGAVDADTFTAGAEVEVTLPTPPAGTSFSINVSRPETTETTTTPAVPATFTVAASTGNTAIAGTSALKQLVTLGEGVTIPDGEAAPKVLEIHGDTPQTQVFNVLKDGTVNCTSQNLTSDIRLKENIAIESGADCLEDLAQIDCLTYEMRGKAARGVSAQAIKEVMPELVAQNGEYLAVNYAGLTAACVGAINELNAKLAALSA